MKNDKKSKRRKIVFFDEDGKMPINTFLFIMDILLITVAIVAVLLWT